VNQVVRIRRLAGGGNPLKVVLTFQEASLRRLWSNARADTLLIKPRQDFQGRTGRR